MMKIIKQEEGAEGENTGEERNREWRREYSDVNCVEKHVVGVEEDIKKVAELLTADAGHVCIHGMGGVGKTALAKQIYLHSKIRSHFDAFAWATVSDNFWRNGESETRKDALLRKILTQLTRAGDHLLTELRATEGRKCLVILDDVWMDLTSLTTLMFFGFPSVTVLVTTRNKPAARPGLNILSHELRCLDANQSWRLFEAKANFGRAVTGSDECYRGMKEIGERMLEYCAGLPLAITVLGHLLSDKHTVQEWEEIFHKNLNTTKGDGRAEQQDVIFEDVLWVLKLSCKELPHELSNCFKYLAHFPRDSKIRMKELCQMHAAEESSVKIGFRAEPYECFKLLVERSLVQVQKLDSCGEIKRLRMHNLMRDLCCSEAGCFVKLVNSRNVEKHFSPSRRMSFQLHKDPCSELLPWIKENGSVVQSLLCFTTFPHPSYEQVMQPLLNKFRSLRVLKFENVTQGHIGNLPEEIGELTDLRVLSLKGSHVQQVPSSIGNLANLETLDLRTSFSTKLPNVMWKLEQLRHLYLARRSSIAGNELMRVGNLRFLETLVNVPLMYCDLNELNGLTRVAKLKTYFAAKWWKKIDPRSVLCLVLVRSLALENISRAGIDLMRLVSSRRVEKLRVEGRISKLAEASHFPALMKLTLNRTSLKDDPMATLEKAPNLRSLVLCYNAFAGTKMVCSSGGFSKLESLSVVVLEYLQEWTIEKGAFPSLSYLLIERCNGLEAVPGGLRRVISLEKLVIRRMPEEFKIKIKERGRDFNVVQHVAEIVFQDYEREYDLIVSESDSPQSGSKRRRVSD